MTPAQLRQAHKKFDALRVRYLATKKRADDQGGAAERRYGPGGIRWATASETKKYEDLLERQRKVENEFFALIQSISPRNWESGAPAWWIYEKLSFEDAVRPRSERLSVTPPLSYGTTRHME